MLLQKKQWLRICILIAITVASSAASLWIQNSSLGKWLEFKTYDLRFRLRGPLPPTTVAPITIVAIDEYSFENIPDPLVFWQKHIAKFIAVVTEAGAETIGLDVLLSDSKRIDPKGYQELVGTLLANQEKKVPVFLAFLYRESRPEQFDEMLNAVLEYGPYAYANLTADSDDFIRRQEIFGTNSAGQRTYGLAMAIAKSYAESKSKSLTLPPNNPSMILINFRGVNQFNQVSLARVLEANLKRDTAFLEENFRGRMVLLGRVGQRGEEDVHATPMYYWAEPKVGVAGTRTPGVEIHANTIATLLEGNFIRELEFSKQRILTLLLVALTALFSFQMSPIRGATLSTLLILGYLVSVCVPLFRMGLWIYVVAPVVGMLLSGSLAAFSNYVLEGREKKRVRHMFERYVSRQVVEQILHAPGGVSLRGDRKELTVLFADVRDFTTLSEGMDPEALVDQLNRYFTLMVQEIQNRRGLVDKFMGDGIMAVFGAPLADPDAPRSAVEAARGMCTALEKLNQQLAAEGVQPMRIGIGIDTGEAVIGNIGSPNKMEYTTIGDVVNTASRIEGLNKLLSPGADASILISARTHAKLNGECNAKYMGDHKLKGKGLETAIYLVTS